MRPNRFPLALKLLSQDPAEWLWVISSPILMTAAGDVVICVHIQHFVYHLVIPFPGLPSRVV